MTDGPDVGKSIRFKDPDGYPTWADIIDSDTQNGVSGWIVDLTTYDEEGYPNGSVPHFVADSDIEWVEEFPCDGKGKFVIYGQVGLPEVTEEVHNDVTLISTEFAGGPQKLGEICLCASDPESLRDLANFLNEQARVMEAIGEDFDHAHYRNRHGTWPDIIVSKVPEQDREIEAE